jgi:hypothetical protein
MERQEMQNAVLSSQFSVLSSQKGKTDGRTLVNRHAEINVAGLFCFTENRELRTENCLPAENCFPALNDMNVS